MGGSHVETAGDVGQKLTVVVTATDREGQHVSATASPVGPVTAASGGGGGSGSVAPALAAARESHRVWVEGNRLARFSRRHGHPIGTTFSFALNEAALVRFAFSAVLPGRRVGKHCVALSTGNRHKRPCTRLMLAAQLTFAGHPGSNRLMFQGRISSKRKLKLGSYRLIIAARNPTGQQSSPSVLTFKIVRR
jgi:hypothetical protein